MEEVLEAATKDLLGREYYERREESAKGYRNGYRESRLKISEGEVKYAVPQVRASDEKHPREATRGSDRLPSGGL